MLAFLITLSFLFTAPNLSPEWQGFPMKDLLLVGAAGWTADDSLRAAERNRSWRPVARELTSPWPGAHCCPPPAADVSWVEVPLRRSAVEPISPYRSFR